MLKFTIRKLGGKGSGHHGHGGLEDVWGGSKPSLGGLKDVWGGKKGLGRYKPRVVETRSDKQERYQEGYDRVITVSAKKLKDELEKRVGEDPLDWSKGKLRVIRGQTEFSSYPKVFLNDKGKIDIRDGRHRIAVASERGQMIDIAVPYEHGRLLKDFLEGEEYSQNTRFEITKLGGPGSGHHGHGGLKDVWGGSTPGKGEVVPKELQPLAEELKKGIAEGKYKTAEEFIEKSPNIIFRTEKPDIAYKGKAQFGKGKYFTFTEAEAGELMLAPGREIIEEWTPEKGGVGAYVLPSDAKLKTIDIDNMSEDEKTKLYAQIDIEGKGSFKNNILKEGYDGVRIITEDLNLGGNQVILFNKDIIDKTKKISKQQLTDFYNQVVGKEAIQPKGEEYIKKMKFVISE